MTTFLLELWLDLKEKRLWPVAVLLVAALVAVPLVLAKPVEELPAPVPGTGVVQPTGDLAQVLPADLEAAKPLLETSTLSEFDSKNPFKPLKALQPVQEVADLETLTDDFGPSGDLDADVGGDTGSTGGTTPAPPESEETVTYTFQAIVELGTANGTRKRVVNRLGILPSETNPLLVFLGVSADNNGEAVFLVDSTVSQAGEGRCKPSAKTCSLLYLTTEEAQDEHIFTPDHGKEYTVKLLRIRRVPVQTASAGSAGSDSPMAQTGLAPDDSSAPTLVADISPADASTEEVASDDEDRTRSPFAGIELPFFADEEE